MTDYWNWNNAICNFFTETGVPGSPVHLAFNDEALIYIGRSYLKLPPTEHLPSFINAVKSECTSITNFGRAVDLSKIRDKTTEGYPKGAAFLSAMVLAAHRMSDKDAIDSNNYFTRFRELLGLADQGKSRPLGFETGGEEALWICWNNWLTDRSFIPTAKRGPEGSMKYLNYTISQALLRDDDKSYLERLFRRKFANEKHLQLLDESQLGSWINEYEISRKHLAEGFNSSDWARYTAFLDEAFQVYQSIIWDSSESFDSSRSITCGLKKSVSITGKSTFKLLAREPSRWKPVELTTKNPNNDETVVLSRLRPGIFVPLWEIDPFIEEAKSWSIYGDSDFPTMSFPKKNFWILTHLQEDYDAGLATWERYPDLIGVKFSILIDKSDTTLSAELDKYRESELLEWSRVVHHSNNSIEYSGCMITARAWDSVIPEHEAMELFTALKPRSYVRVSLAGGIRATGGDAWLEGFPPLFRLHGFEENFKFAVYRGEELVEEGETSVQQDRELLSCKISGRYQIEIFWAGEQVTTRVFSVVPWDSLKRSSTQSSVFYSCSALKGKKLQGPIIID